MVSHFLTFLDQVADRGPALGAFLARLEELAGDFLERQEAVAFGAVIHEGRFEARLDAGDAALVDVGFLGFPGRDLDVEVVDSLAVNQRDAQLFFLSCIDEHSFHRSSQMMRSGP